MTRTTMLPILSLLALLATPQVASAQSSACTCAAPAESPGMRIARGTTFTVFGAGFIAGGIATEVARDRKREDSGISALGDIIEYSAFALGAAGLAGGIYVLATPPPSPLCRSTQAGSLAGVGPGNWLWPSARVR